MATLDRQSMAHPLGVRERQYGIAARNQAITNWAPALFVEGGIQTVGASFNVSVHPMLPDLYLCGMDPLLLLKPAAAERAVAL